MIANTQNPLSIRYHDDIDVEIGTILEDTFHMSGIGIAEVNAARLAKLLTKLLYRTAHDGRIDGR